MPEILVPLSVDTIPVTLTGTGSAVPFPPPPQRARWQILTGPATGGYSQELAAAQNRKYTRRLEEADDLSFDMSALRDLAEPISPLATDAHLLWTPPGGGTARPLMRGRFGGTGNALDPNTHRLTPTVLDYRAVLDNRQLWSDSQLTWAGIDQAEIVWQLIQQAQTRTGGDLGISKGWTGIYPTGTLRDRTYEAGNKIGERITELSQVINGFDWAITPTSASALRLDVWAPERGTNRGVVFESGGLVTHARREYDIKGYGNALRYTGADGLTPVEIEASDLATRPEGRWDLAFGDTGLITQSALDDRAAWQLEQSQNIEPVYTMRLRPGCWGGPDDFDVGDSARVVIYGGGLEVDTIQRIYEMAFSIDASGVETLEVTTGGPKPDRARKAVSIDRRLKNLELR